MTMTYAEAIEAARAEREELSAQINALFERRRVLSQHIFDMEETVRPPKRGKALPGDVVMVANPATVGMAALPKG